MVRHKFLKGYTPWNKGLTKETDKRLVRTEAYIKSRTGEGNSFYGKKHTSDSKKKIGNRKYSTGEEHHLFGKHIWEGKYPPKGMLGKKGYWAGKHRSEDTKNKLKIANLGKKHTVESIEKMRITHKEDWKNPDFVEKWKIGTARYKKNGVYPTKPEAVLIEIIKENNLPFDYTGDAKFWICKFNPDFLNKREKLIIEVFGDYWHNRIEVKIRDKKRLKIYSKYGYKTLIIWEHELIKVNYKDKGILTKKQIINKIKDKNNFYYLPEVSKPKRKPVKRWRIYR